MTHAPQPSMPSFDPTLTLSDNELRTFARDGILVVPSGVEDARVEAARRAINMRLYQLISGGSDGSSDAGISHDDATRAAFSALAASPRLRSALHSLIGPWTTPSSGQIALNFPERGQGKADAWHVDGMADGKVNPFTVLVCVALSDQTRDIGNFRAAVGSHVAIAHATREYHEETGSFNNTPDGANFRAWKASGAGNLPPFDPQPVMLKPGDVAIVHAKTAHRRGQNSSPDVRYMAIFRVRAEAHDAQDSAQIRQTFPPAVYPGLVGLVDQAAMEVS